MQGVDSGGIPPVPIHASLRGELLMTRSLACCYVCLVLSATLRSGASRPKAMVQFMAGLHLSALGAGGRLMASER